MVQEVRGEGGREGLEGDCRARMPEVLNTVETGSVFSNPDDVTS